MNLARPAIIKAALGAGALLAVTALAAAFFAISELVDTARLFGRAITQLGRIEALRADISGAQALQQRSMLATDERAASDYVRRKAAVAQSAAELVRHATGEEYGQRARELAQAVAQLFALLDEALELRKRGASGTELNPASDSPVVAAAGEVQRLASNLFERSRSLQQERGAQAESEVRFTVALVAMAGAFALGFFAAAALLLGRFQRQRDNALADLAALEHRLEMAVSGSELVVWDWDSRSDSVYLSAGWSKIVGGPPSARTTTPKALTALVHPEDLDRLQAAVAAMNDGGQDAYRVEHRVRAEDGSYHWINSRGKVVARDARGRTLRVTGTNADITVRKRVELALAASERELRLVADAVPAMIAYVDAGERYRFYNRAFERWIGVAAPEGYGRTVRELTGEERYAGIEQHLRRALAGEEVRFERRETLQGSQEMDLAAVYVPHRTEDGTVLGVYALLTDITELKQIDRLKTEFVSTVSHELRTPITAMRGALGLLHAGAAGVLPERAAKLVGIAESSCERLVRLVNDILDLEKIAAGKLEFRLSECDLVQLVQQAIAAIEAYAAERGISLRLDRVRERVRALADPDRVIQVLSNLLSNAVRFSPAGAAVELAIESAAGFHRVSVRDHGPGVAVEFRPRLFQKFAQADTSNARASGGTGLGLAISKSIIERMGGHIGFEPAAGGGSVFFFDLPDVKKDAQSASMQAESPAAQSGPWARAGASGDIG